MSSPLCAASVISVFAAVQCDVGISVAPDIAAVLSDLDIQAHWSLARAEMEDMIAEPKLQKQARRIAEQVESMVGDQHFQAQVKQIADQIGDILADTNLQKQAGKLIGEQLDAIRTSQVAKEHAKIITKQLEGLIVNPSFKNKAELIAHDLKAILADANVQKHMKQFFERIDALTSNMQQAERAPEQLLDEMLRVKRMTHSHAIHREHVADKLVDNLFGWALKAPGLRHANANPRHTFRNHPKPLQSLEPTKVKRLGASDRLDPRTQKFAFPRAVRTRIENNIGNDELSPLAATSLKDTEETFVNYKIFGQLMLNQVVIALFSGKEGLDILTSKINLFNPSAWLIGLLAALPMIAVGRLIEKSDSPLFTDLNLSTKLTVLRLLGNKAQPAIAFAVSLALCALVAVCEETVFRGKTLGTLTQWAVDRNYGALAVPLGLLGSAFVFALGHISPSLSKDTLVLGGLQVVTGLIFGSLYVLTGDLTPSIVTHFLYDFDTIYGTHTATTDQITYTNTAAIPVGSNDEKWRKEMGDEIVKEARQAYFLMDTNRDGLISQGELRMGFAAMGFQQTEAKFQRVFERMDLDKSGKVNFDEFLSALSAYRGGAVQVAQKLKNSLLGVRT